MNRSILVIILTFLVTSSRSQTFLDALKEYKLTTVAPKLKSQQRKKFIAYTNATKIELDTIFNSYKSKTGFNFNTADTIFLIYESPVESPFLSDIIIWSRNDTIAYGHELKPVKPSGYKRIAVYKPYLVSFQRLPGYKEVTERDSLVTLVSNREFDKILHLGDNQLISDGSYITIYVAIKINGRYKIETCSPPQFVINTVYRKE